MSRRAMMAAGGGGGGPPSVLAANGAFNAALTTALAVPIPMNEAGDLLILFAGAAGTNARMPNTPAGWTSILQTSSTNAINICWLVSPGGLASVTYTIAMTGGGSGSPPTGQVIVIKKDTFTVPAQLVVSGQSGAAAPPAMANPWGEPALVLGHAMLFKNFAVSGAVNGYPSNMTGQNIVTNTSTSGSQSFGLATAELPSGTFTPAAFTNSGGSSWLSQTVLVRGK